jgi:hypothetical protein
LKKNTKFITGETKKGFKFSIDPENLDDIEFIELLNDADKNPSLLPKILEKLFGEKGKKRMYNVYRKKNGTVPLSEINNAIIEIFNLVGALKK